MKKLFALFSLFLVMAFSSITAYAVAGNGTEDDPFLITNQDELLLISDFSDCCFRLDNDIILEGQWTPICKSSNAFTGILDGNGHTISNINLSANRNNGFFVVNNGTIKNLNFYIKSDGINNDFYDKSGYNYNFGIISVVNNGIISNCKVNGSIKVSNEYYVGLIYIGSVVGQNNGIIKNISSNVIIKTSGFATDYVGGIAGINNTTAEITGVSSKCKLTCEDYRGGIVGENNGIISNSYYISEDCPISGGIAYSGKGTIENSYASVVASKTNYVRGIICNVEKSPVINNCFYDQTLSNAVNNNYGTPKSTIAMKMKRTFTTAGWDFDNIWGIDENINNGYPYLLWEYAPTENQISFDYTAQKAKVYVKNAGTYTVIFANYSENTLVETDVQTLSMKQGYNNISTNLTLTNGDKIFLWQDMKTLTPVCESAVISLK